MNSRFYFIAKSTLILVYGVILAGSVVRMTGSGMGCPDWPKCFGYLIPPTDHAQLEWTPNHSYNKGNIIIVNESLQVAKYDFVSSSTYNSTQWEAYTKHDYAEFNPFHTWVEFINRLLGALAGLATVLMFVFSLQFWKDKKRISILSFLAVLGMGFQAWLGKTVVDSNLAPFKITIHMVMALVIVALLLWILKPYARTTRNLVLRNTLWVALGLTLLQIIMGTQVRQFVDIQVGLWGYDQTNQWLDNVPVVFYIHRSFSIAVVMLHLYLLKLSFSQQEKTRHIYWILGCIGLEVITGIIMYYGDFPFASQPIHLFIASILFGIQMDWWLHETNTKKQHNDLSI